MNTVHVLIHTKTGHIEVFKRKLDAVFAHVNYSTRDRVRYKEVTEREAIKMKN